MTWLIFVVYFKSECHVCAPAFFYEGPARALPNQLGTDACTKKKKMRKGTFFGAEMCAALSSFRVGKIQILLERVGFSGCNA